MVPKKASCPRSWRARSRVRNRRRNRAPRTRTGSREAGRADIQRVPSRERSEEHTSELQSLMRISYAVFCLKKKKQSKHKRKQRLTIEKCSHTTYTHRMHN